jgi:hypothetical protein
MGNRPWVSIQPGEDVPPDPPPQFPPPSEESPQESLYRTGVLREAEDILARRGPGTGTRRAAGH